MANPREKFQGLLRKLFQFDCAELDFGIYRIMNQKRDVIEKFIEKDLLDGVATELTTGALAQESGLAQALAEVSAQIKENFGDEALDAEGNLAKEYQTTPRGKQYLELRERASSARSSTELETEIFNHLYAFFSRYYDEGDFMSLRRYSKRDKYAIPYNGEEVHLHWANADQYYIKTGENFTDYSFKHGGWTVSFKLRNASVEQNNVKGAKRFFLPRVDDVAVDKKTCILTVPFEYRPLTNDEETRYGTKLTQNKILDEAYPKVLAAGKTNQDALAALLHEKRKDSEGKSVTLLEHHLHTYTRINTSDFFIHKDLKGFLERELDFYLKNEILNIDEIEVGAEARSPRWFQMMTTIKAIGRKIIIFLAQIEDFQKRIFEKRKFITETNYCLTIDRVPEDLYPEIIINKEQIEEWKYLFKIHEIAGDLATTAFSTPLKKEFLKSHPRLVLDTRFFSESFKDRLLASDRFLAKGSINDSVSGLLANSENLQAVSTLGVCWKGKLSSFYSDPPFNLGENADFAYKTDYQDSSWLTLLQDRVIATVPLLSKDALVFVRCDYHGSHLVRMLLERLGLLFKAEILIDRSRNEAGSPNKMEATYEHLFMFGVADMPIQKFTVARSLSNIKWTGFLMAGDRNPPERIFLGKTIHPPAGQHFSLKQSKVDKLLSEFFLRLKCSECGCLYFGAHDDSALERQMKSKENRFKFYDIINGTIFHGVETLDKCIECGKKNFKVEYLGSDEVFVNENWLDIPSYSRRWGFSTENSEELLDRVTEFTTGGAIDLFGGSGTTAAVALKKSRNFFLCEFGMQFYEVILPRLKQVLFGEDSGISLAKGWKGGGCFKYLSLESYEDALDNISFQSPDKQDMFKLDDYVLSYMLDFETRQSETLLNVAKLDTPFDYKLKRHGRDKALPVDLPETFNYLIGLHVDTRRVLENKGNRYLVYRGKAEDRQAVVIWRTTSGWGQKEFEQDRDFVLKEKLTDSAEDVFVNTDSFIPGARSLDPVFKHRMFNEE